MMTHEGFIEIAKRAVVRYFNGSEESVRGNVLITDEDVDILSLDNSYYTWWALLRSKSALGTAYYDFIWVDKDCKGGGYLEIYTKHESKVIMRGDLCCED